MTALIVQLHMSHSPAPNKVGASQLKILEPAARRSIRSFSLAGSS